MAASKTTISFSPAFSTILKGCGIDQLIEQVDEVMDRAEVQKRTDNKVTLQCNECGRKRKVSPDGNYNERCPKCGGVDWDVLGGGDEFKAKHGMSRKDWDAALSLHLHGDLL